MFSTAIFSVILSTLLSTTAAAPTPAPPACNATSTNTTLRAATMREAGIISSQAQMMGASIHLISYQSWGELVPGSVQPITDSLHAHWIPALNAVDKQCVCKGKGSMPFDVLSSMLGVTTNMLESLNQNQCSVEGYTPSEATTIAMRPFIDTLFAAVGTGSFSSKAGLSEVVPAGAIIPYYQCLVSSGSAHAAKQFTEQWFALNKVLVELNNSACV